MKVVQYLHTDAGGHLRYTTELANALSVQPRITSLVITGPNAPETVGAPLLRVLSAPNTRLGGMRRILDRMRVYLRQPAELRRALDALGDGSTAICHFQQLPSILPTRTLSAARKAGFAPVVTVHNVIPHAPLTFTTRLKTRQLRRAWADASHLIVHTSMLRDALRLSLGEACPPVTVIPHPVWLNEAAQLAPGEVKDFLFFGTLRANKGLDLFIEALAILGDPSSSIRGAGTSQEVAQVKRALKNAKLQNCEFIEDYVADEEVPKVFANHAVLVAPYRDFHAQSGVTHLALSHKTPIVVTRVGGLPELVDEYGVGEACAQTGDDLAAAMTSVLKKERTGSFTESISRATSSLSMASVAKRHALVYKTVRNDE